MLNSEVLAQCSQYRPLKIFVIQLALGWVGDKVGDAGASACTGWRGGGRGVAYSVRAEVARAELSSGPGPAGGRCVVVTETVPPAAWALCRRWGWS